MPKSPKPSRRPAVRSRASAAAKPFTPAAMRARHDGWTRERQTGFIQALAEGGCVEEACAAVGMSRQSAYRLRARIDAQGFRVAWDKALDYAIRRLSDACLARALHGEARPIFYQGEQIGERRHYDNKLAMFLLRYRDPLRYAASLDQMAYSGHPESAAIDLTKAIQRVADEAEGLAEPEEDRADPQPYVTESIGEVRAKAEMAAFLAGDGPIHGSHERRTRLQAARNAYRLKQSGYKTQEAFDAATQAQVEAQSEADMKTLRAIFDLNEQTDDGPAHAGADSGPDVSSPLSPSAAADPALPPPKVPGASPLSGAGWPRAAKPKRRIEPSVRSIP